MHLIVPFAAPLSAALRAQFGALRAPALQAWLQRQPPPQTFVAGDEWSLSTPHERALSQLMGWPAADGLVPLAQAQAMQQGLAEAARPGWACVAPTHWSLGTEQISLFAPELLNLDVESSRAFFQAIGELFTSEGFAWHWLGPTQWLCRHDELAELPTASLDRVIGRNVDRWLTPHPRARRLRRLQNEAQMLMHGHALNEPREAQGLLPLNSLWCSGTGSLDVAQGETPEAAQIHAALRGPALQEDAAGWAQAFAQADAQVFGPWIAQHGEDPASSLILCGERQASRWSGGPPSRGSGFWPALGRRLGLGASADPARWPQWLEPL
ncbi:MAG: hypothetical protein JNJ71_06325 [Rubrivivax sp.]|nr:hypothetical protein [Rubrivivax sp.]